MKKKRTIMIFPRFHNIGVINDIRKKYDPLADKVLPHITLVFPFESELGNGEIIEWLSVSLKDIKPFTLRMSGFSKQADVYGDYLFLNVSEGREVITGIHDSLYQGILEKYKADYPYEPHMTVGRLSSKEKTDSIIENLGSDKEIYETTVDTISVEMIGVNEESIIEIEYKLYR